MIKSAKVFRKTGKVSVWIGNMKTPEELDQYMNLSSAFEHDFGFTLDERDVQEATVEEFAKPISELIDGFSACDSFAANVVKAANGAGIREASTMLVYYAFDFDPSQVVVNPKAPLRFLGSFQFTD